MSICAETQGGFELDPESSEPNENCVFAMLIQAGYTSSSLASADEKGALPMDFIYRSVYPNTGTSQVISKLQPDCPKLAAIVRKCKFEISATAAYNLINKDDEKRLTRLLPAQKSATSNVFTRKKPRP